MISYIRKPCSECPWRCDVPPGQFSPGRFRALAPSAYDLARMVFACHKSAEGAHFACAGFLLRGARHNLTIRMERKKFEVHSPYPLYDNYRELAIANGVPPDDPSLDEVRVD